MALTVDIEKKLGSFTLRLAFSAGDETLALLGASGCGKSMTLKCIAGIERPDRGKIVLDGVTLFDSEKRIDLPPQQRRVGYLFQQYALFPHMTARQNIACGVRDKNRALEKADGMLRALGLEGDGHKRPFQLSGGQQQRVALGRILVNEPNILLLDEPFSALDSHLRFRLEQELRHTIQGFGKTVVLVSHDRDEVYRLSDTVALMDQGAIHTIGSRQEVFARPRTRLGAMLTGCKNISPLRPLPDGRVLAEDWGLPLAVAGPVGNAAYVGIRMHALRAGAGENSFPFTVTEVIENPFSRTVMLRYLDAPDAAPLGWEVDKAAWQGHPGDAVTVCLPTDQLLLLEE